MNPSPNREGREGRKERERERESERAREQESERARERESKRARERERAHERIDDEFDDAFRHKNARNCSLKKISVDETS